MRISNTFPSYQSSYAVENQTRGIWKTAKPLALSDINAPKRVTAEHLSLRETATECHGRAKLNFLPSFSSVHKLFKNTADLKRQSNFPSCIYQQQRFYYNAPMLQYEFYILANISAKCVLSLSIPSVQDEPASLSTCAFVPFWLISSWRCMWNR